MSLEGPEASNIPIGWENVAQAAGRIAPWVHRTPVLTSKALDERCGGSLFLKCENFQKVGAFKFRGAMNALLQLSDAEKRAGAITHSSGNHAQAVALAGRLLGVPVTVVMPRTAPAVKRAATEGYGARVVPCEPTFALPRSNRGGEEIKQHSLTMVHPFNDWNVIAGQGTATWELLEESSPLDLVLSPVGGGGLLAGTALAADNRSPRPRVIGVEPANADDAKRSLEAGAIQQLANDPKTIADGLRTTSIGERTFAVISRRVDQIVTVTESEIIDAMQLIWERIKIVVEPSGAVPIRGPLERQPRRP